MQQSPEAACLPPEGLRQFTSTERCGLKGAVLADVPRSRRSVLGRGARSTEEHKIGNQTGDDQPQPLSHGEPPPNSRGGVSPAPHAPKQDAAPTPWYPTASDGLVQVGPACVPAADFDRGADFKTPDVGPGTVETSHAHKPAGRAMT